MAHVRWLEDRYRQPGHKLAFSGRTALGRHFGTRLKPEAIEKWLSSVHAYTLHRESKRPRKRNPYFIYKLRQQVQMDLVDFNTWGKNNLPDHNDGYRFIITAIDSFSRKGWIAKIKSKGANDALDGIKAILHKMETEDPFLLPKSIYADQGGELKNRVLDAYLQSKNIRIYYAVSDVKAAIVERWNKTLQELVYKHLSEKETFRWIDIIDGYVDTYNKRGHRSLQYMSPNQAEEVGNQTRVLGIHEERYAAATQSKRLPKYKVDDIVRVRLKRNIFQRGYHERFSPDLFKIISINTRLPQPMYKVENLSTAKQPSNTYYFEQLQPVNTDVFRVESVVREEKRKGKKWYLVKWMNFHSGHNSWIPAENIVADFRSGQQQLKKGVPKPKL